MNKPVLIIYRHRKTGDFLIQRFAVEPQWKHTVAYGESSRISVDAMQDDGYQIVQAELDAFNQRGMIDRANLPPFSDKALDRLQQECDLVGVRAEPGGRVVLTPMRRESAGYVGGPRDEIILDAPCDAQRFFAQLSQAFDALAQPN